MKFSDHEKLRTDKIYYSLGAYNLKSIIHTHA